MKKVNPLLGAILKVASFLVLLFANSSPNCVRAEDGSDSLKDDSALCEVAIDGKHIKRLVLESKSGDTKEFKNPGEVIKLEPGRYQPQEVHLADGYVHNSRDLEYIVVERGKSAVLKVGAPLKQKVKTTRRGTMLVLNYELVGRGGEKYLKGTAGFPGTKRAAPEFAIYRGEEKVASGSFEFG